ncbi:MAG TPA: LuxR C-terminal-related transcriptional regulator [Streptosporangiaceae bacterium]
MTSRSATRDAMALIIAACHQGHPPERLKAEVLTRLRRVLPVDAVWWATSDPATLLFTQAFREGLPDRSIPYFVDNEFLGHDVNRWTELARDPGGVRTLSGATNGEPAASARFRDLFQPLGLGDELRAVLRTGDACWGLMCLHREAGLPFSPAEEQLVRQLAPHLAEGIRAGLLMPGTTERTASDAPGLVVLDQAGELVTATAAAQAWFAEFGHDARTGRPVPAEVSTAAGLLRRAKEMDRLGCDSTVPRLRVRTRAGHWAVLHASWLELAQGEPPRIAVIIETATPAEVAMVIMQAYGLTERERTVTGLVCQGRSTRQIAAKLWISPTTVQDHLKSVFDKTGVRSRREVMAVILRDHYLPALRQSRPVGPAGFFAPPAPANPPVRLSAR